MKHIPTSDVDVSKLRKAAKRHTQASPDTKHAAALDAVAVAAGYAHWTHVLVCQEATRAAAPTSPTKHAPARRQYPSLAELGYLPDTVAAIERSVKRNGGLVIVAGGVNGGRTTTLESMCDLDVAINKERIFRWDHSQAESATAGGQGRPADSAGQILGDEGLVSMLRSDVRSMVMDPPHGSRASLVIEQVVFSGHKAYMSMLANSALDILPRMVDEFGFSWDFLRTPRDLDMLVYQRLLPTNCPHCCHSPDDLKVLNLQGGALKEHHRFWERIEKLYGLERGRYRMRNQQGCSHCRKSTTGLGKSTVVSEHIEIDRAFLQAMAPGDTMAQLHRIWRSRSDGRIESASMAGKSIRDCAMHKATLGEIDPQIIELYLGTLVG